MSDSGFASLGPSLLARKGGAKPAMRPQVAPLVAGAPGVPEDQLEDLGWNDMGDTGDDLPRESGADIVPINADIAAGGFAADDSPIVRRQQRRLEERVLADAAMTGPEDAAEADAWDAGEDEAEDEDEAGEYSDGYTAGNAQHPAYAADETKENEDGDADENDARYADAADFAAPAFASARMHRPAKVPAIALAPEAAPVPARAAATPRTPAVQAGRRAAFTLRLDADRHLKLRLAATMQGISAQALVTEALDRLLAEYDDLDVIAAHLKRH